MRRARLDWVEHQVHPQTSGTAVERTAIVLIDASVRLRAAQTFQIAVANWRYGRWLLLETAGYSASVQIYTYLTAVWVDTAAVGALSAVFVLDSTNLIRIVQTVQPDEIYNLGAQSHVAVSFESPEYTANSDVIGTLRLLEAIRILGLESKTRFYQASTSEMFGKVLETPQRETTPFYPRSPYGVAKLYGWFRTQATEHSTDTNERQPSPWSLHWKRPLRSTWPALEASSEALSFGV